MKCQILFSGKNKKFPIHLSSVESAHSVVSVTKKNIFLDIPFIWSLDWLQSPVTKYFSHNPI